MVWVIASHSNVNAIPVYFYIETNKNKYARSPNPVIFGIDASFIYNKGRFVNKDNTDAAFYANFCA